MDHAFWSDGETSVRGQQWAWRQGGHGELDVLLVHGWQNDASSWDPLVAGLDGYRRTLVDLPGCGRSPAPAAWERSTIDELGRDLAQLLGELAILHPVIIGHSLGGAIAIELALAEPDLPAGLVLFGPASTTGLDFVSAADFEVLIHPTPEQRRALIRAAFHRRPTDEELDALEAIVAAAHPHHVEGAARSMRSFTVQQRLGEITAPTLVVVGDRDRHVPLRNHLATWQQLRRAGLHVIHDVGHVPFVEDPVASIAVTRHFLDHERR